MPPNRNRNVCVGELPEDVVMNDHVIRIVLFVISVFAGSEYVVAKAVSVVEIVAAANVSVDPCCADNTRANVPVCAVAPPPPVQTDCVES